jgi:hypothetical protein
VLQPCMQNGREERVGGQTLRCDEGASAPTVHAKSTGGVRSSIGTSLKNNSFAL